MKLKSYFLSPVHICHLRTHYSHNCQCYTRCQSGEVKVSHTQITKGSQQTLFFREFQFMEIIKIRHNCAWRQDDDVHSWMWILPLKSAMAPLRLVVLGMMGYGCVHVVVPCYYYKKEHRIKEQSTTNQRKNGGAVFKNTFSSILTHTYRTHSCS